MLIQYNAPTRLWYDCCSLVYNKICCRDPPLLPHTSIALLNGSTQWRARAIYSCLPGYNPTKGRSENISHTCCRCAVVVRLGMRKKNICLFQKIGRGWWEQEAKALSEARNGVIVGAASSRNSHFPPRSTVNINFKRLQSLMDAIAYLGFNVMS